jgi:mono/diheme cytochrome c family protein
VKGPARATFVVSIAALAGALGAGCGEEKVKSGDRGAQLFSERCSGCHTLSEAGAEGSISGTRPTGPNLDQRKETPEQVKFAIENGGFSGAIMPQNIVVGKDRDAVAEFVAKYAGKKAKAPPSPTTSTGSTGESGQSGAGGQ